MSSKTNKTSSSKVKVVMSWLETRGKMRKEKLVFLGKISSSWYLSPCLAKNVSGY